MPKQSKNVRRSVLVKIVGAGGYADKWVDPDLACLSMRPGVRQIALERLVNNGWAAKIGGAVQVTVEGLKVLERA